MRAEHTSEMTLNPQEIDDFLLSLSFTHALRAVREFHLPTCRARVRTDKHAAAAPRPLRSESTKIAISARLSMRESHCDQMRD